MLLQDFTGPTFLFWLYTARVCLLCIIGAYRYSSWMGVLRKPNFFPCWVRHLAHFVRIQVRPVCTKFLLAQ